jgi:hypothetical protein
VELADGRQVAYAASDVDLDALRAQDAATEAAPPERAAEGIASALAATGAESSVTISDEDVQHVAPAEDGSGGATAAGPPPGYREGGQVALQGIQLIQVEPGVWEVTGEVVNRTDRPVGDVRVALELHTPVEGTLAKADVPVTTALEPTAKAGFSHRFTVAAAKPPSLRGRVFWMQEEPVNQAPLPVFGGSDAASSGGGEEPRPTPRS